MTVGFNYFLRALRFGGLAPSVKINRIESGQYSKLNFIYPILAVIITWSNCLRYSVFLLFIEKPGWWMAQALLYFYAIGNQINCALTRTSFVWSHWKRNDNTVVELFNQCSMNDTEGMRLTSNLEDIKNFKVEHRNCLLWKILTTLGIVFVFINAAFTSSLTFVQRGHFGIGSTLTITHGIGFQDPVFIFAAIFTTLINAICDLSHLGTIMTTGLSFTLALRFRDLRYWLKDKRKNGDKVILKNIHDYYCHLVDLVKEVDCQVQFRNGINLIFNYFGTLVSLYHFGYGENFDNDILARFTLIFWLSSCLFMLFLILIPSIYINAKAREAKRE